MVYNWNYKDLCKIQRLNNESDTALKDRLFVRQILETNINLFDMNKINIITYDDETNQIILKMLSEVKSIEVNIRI